MNEGAKAFLRDCVIQCTLDDYENIDVLDKDISLWAKKENQPYSLEELVEVVQTLTNEGLLKPYRYSQQHGKFVNAEFSRAALRELWFLAVS